VGGEPDAVAANWSDILGKLPEGVAFAFDEREPGLTEIVVSVPGRSGITEIGGVRFRLSQEEDR
jgi:hypothetical protein